MEGDDTLAYLGELEQQNKKLQAKNTEYESAIANTSFQNQGDQNLVQWQVDADDILDKIEHFLRGDVVKTDDTGNTYFEAQTEENLIILNEYGVNSIMQILGNYVNRNVILSFYDEERINEILGDLGDHIGDFIECNYEKMGMTTDFKKSRFILLVLNICHIIESSFRRALMGRTSKEINSNTNIIQSESFGINTRAIPKKRFNPFKPSTY